MFNKDKKSTGAETTSTISTLLGRDTVIEGMLTFKETIRVDGRIKGSVRSEKGTLIIGEHADLEADIQVGVAIVRGKVNGRLDATQRIEIHAPAKVNGDIRSPSVAIDSGVVFNGHCVMERPETTQTKASPAAPATAASSPTDQKVSKKL
jgi:cytoskeletal protein CcmA (bactofilin family)